MVAQMDILLYTIGMKVDGVAPLVADSPDAKSTNNTDTERDIRHHVNLINLVA